MRLAFTLAAASLCTFAAAEARAQDPSARLTLRVSVVQSCGVTTGTTATSPAQVNCSRSTAPQAVMSVGPRERPAAAVTETGSDTRPTPGGIVAAGDVTPAPMPLAVTTGAEADAIPVGTDWLTETPAESGAAAPSPRPVHQVVTINF